MSLSPDWTANSFVVDWRTSLNVKIAFLDDAHGVVPDAVTKLARPKYVKKSIVLSLSKWFQVR